ncbi:MAG: hypothetical protein ACRDHZ_21470 [Ktedonobacteraceae bacterium]
MKIIESSKTRLVTKDYASREFFQAIYGVVMGVVFFGFIYSVPNFFNQLSIAGQVIVILLFLFILGGIVLMVASAKIRTTTFDLTARTAVSCA